ncbi:helix-turn-helix transcriptional regulator [Sedimentibacter hydroxybenzoicus DSM 7310]|uniref:Helix-turn-helix transcriptional regulator n=2 Tax=Sedimentibacter hydroxybenzoicus TaxID=29345 RepID=A0A974BNE8_SEDHY|nr:helix-turn-helix transcriptional regulator [Sedimentibacter hydroxybenzoicus DSM 7310]
MGEMHKKLAINHFINAADELINEMGIEKVTIRNIAQKAGYNSATIYNYFENLDHLIFFGAMKNITDYALALNSYLADSKNAMDRFLMVWECFFNYAYLKPDIYNAIFFPKLPKHIEEYVSEFYSLFPEDLGIHHDTISTMLLKGNIHDRGMTTVMDCVSEGFIESHNADKLNDMTLLIFEGMLKRVLRGTVNYENAKTKSMDYIKVIVKSFLIKDYNFYF